MKFDPLSPAFPNRTVEDALMPLVKSMRVDVEFAATPNEVVGVYGNPPVRSVAQPNDPAVHVRYWPPPQAPSCAPKKSVVDAVLNDCVPRNVLFV